MTGVPLLRRMLSRPVSCLQSGFAPRRRAPAVRTDCLGTASPISPTANAHAPSYANPGTRKTRVLVRAEALHRHRSAGCGKYDSDTLDVHRPAPVLQSGQPQSVDPAQRHPVRSTPTGQRRWLSSARGAGKSSVIRMLSAPSNRLVSVTRVRTVTAQRSGCLACSRATGKSVLILLSRVSHEGDLVYQTKHIACKERSTSHLNSALIEDLVKRV